MTEDDDLGRSHAGFGAFGDAGSSVARLRKGERQVQTDLYAKREFGSQPLTRKGRCRRTMRFCVRNNHGA